MTSRRRYMGADIDQLLNGELDIEKFCATRSVSPRTAYIWCLERAKSEEEREKVKTWLKEYFEKGIGLL